MNINCEKVYWGVEGTNMKMDNLKCIRIFKQYTQMHRNAHSYTKVIKFKNLQVEEIFKNISVFVIKTNVFFFFTIWPAGLLICNNNIHLLFFNSECYLAISQMAMDRVSKSRSTKKVSCLSSWIFICLFT